MKRRISSVGQPSGGPITQAPESPIILWRFSRAAGEAGQRFEHRGHVGAREREVAGDR